jgi:Adenosine deaminase
MRLAWVGTAIAIHRAGIGRQRTPRPGVLSCGNDVITLDIERALTAAYLQRTGQDNIMHARVFIAPQVHLRRGIPFASMMEDILADLAEAQTGYGLTGGVIVQALLYWAAAMAGFENARLHLPYFRGEDWRNYPNLSMAVMQQTAGAGYVVAFPTIPKMAIAPIIIIWFSYAVTSKNRHHHLTLADLPHSVLAAGAIFSSVWIWRSCSR